MNRALKLFAIALGLMAAPLAADDHAAAPAAPQPAGPVFHPLAGNFPLSEAVQVGDILYLSGQLGIAEDGRSLVEGGIEPQARRTMERIGEVLGKHGLDHNAIFKCTVWLADIGDFGAFNAVYGEFFEPGRYPARSAMAVKSLAANAAVEVECMAWNPQAG